MLKEHSETGQLLKMLLSACPSVAKSLGLLIGRDCILYLPPEGKHSWRLKDGTARKNDMWKGA